MDPWYKIVTPRREVREGRSFSPDEFAIALEQVVTKKAPEDYRDPAQFFARTCWTRALKEHAAMVVRRLAGKTENTPPVLTLITQFGGGKTHTLAALYHLANAGPKATEFQGVPELLRAADVSAMPAARTGVFVGNAWDPQDGRETPWIDLARQIAGENGVEALGAAAKTTPPGTEALGRVFAAAEAPVLILLDEVLNFVNRHRDKADALLAFIQNLTVAATGSTGVAAVISLPRSQVEMTHWDTEWHDRITKVVRRVAKDLIANDEAEIGEVVRRRLFENIGDERVRRRIARNYADWCVERSARLPPEWTAVDSVTNGKGAREFLCARFESTYPFHPATLSVFQRKWQALQQFQRTRGTLAMLAQWISWAAREHFEKARTEPLITLGSAPLHVPEFRAVVLGQLGEPRLDTAIEADICGPLAHARALDTDLKGPIRDLHRRVGTAILFESSGGQVDKIAHLPELRFALGEEEIDTATIDNAVMALEARSFFLRKVGTDGYRIHHQATLRKVVNDRRASLDEEIELKPAVRRLVETEFGRGATVPIVFSPEDSTAIHDSPRLTLVIADPDIDWKADAPIAERIASWTRERGQSPRLYPGSLVWCIRKTGRDLRDKTESWLAWRKVAREVGEGLLGADFEKTDRAEVQTSVKDAEEGAKDEVWAGYRHVAVYDALSATGLKLIDLGAGHSSASQSLCGRIITALKNEGLLNDSIGAGYIDRHWPPAFKDSGAWPLSSLRQSFLNGALTRLIDTDQVLRNKIPQFVQTGEFGLASGVTSQGAYERVWHNDLIGPEEVQFEMGVFLLTKAKAQSLKSGVESITNRPRPEPAAPDKPESLPPKPAGSPSPDQTCTVRVTGTIPPEMWNKFGVKVLTKLRSGGGAGNVLRVGLDFSVSLAVAEAKDLEGELRQILDDLGMTDRIRIERS